MGEPGEGAPRLLGEPRQRRLGRRQWRQRHVDVAAAVAHGANATGAARWQTVKSALFVSVSSRL